MATFCSVSNLCFTYPQQSAPLFRGLSFSLPAGWTGIVGANGSGKSTLARLLVGELAPEEGAVKAPAGCHYCPQECEDRPESLSELLASPDWRGIRAVRLLGIEQDWPDRWAALSFGERKRAQLALALSLDPGLLVLDEPTNHLDGEAARWLRSALSDYRGIGILISHDRDLLDSLCERCLFIDDHRVALRPGGVSAGLREAERERESARRERELARDELGRLRREAHARRALADSADSRLSGRRLSPKDRDGRGKLKLARLTGKDAVGGRLLRQMERRIEAAEARLSQARAPSEPSLGITFDVREARRNLLFRLRAGEIALGGTRTLEIPEVAMSPGDRIALVGPNGAGKSTLVRAIVAAVGDAAPVRPLYLPQELSRERCDELARRLDALDSKGRGEVLSAVKRLGSDPERLLESARPSPGEARKLFLALALSEGTELILLDEPTNHMDLPSILCVEEALAACSASLLFVTHDLRFAERLATIRWRIVADPASRTGSFVLRVE